MRCALIVMFVLGLSSLSLYSQNLVPNPGFECGEDPCEIDQVSKNFPTWACGWMSATCSTPDVFSATIKDPNCSASLPERSFDGTVAHITGLGQIAHSGNRCAGVILYLPNMTWGREYIETKLIEPLVPGEYYCVEMYVSRPDHMAYSSNNLGVYFSDSLYYQCDYSNDDYHELLPFTPQVLFTNIISNEDWIKVSASFQASTAAQYMIIGNFYTNAQTSAVLTRPVAAYYQGYAMIDDISVQHIPRQLTFAGGKDICAGDSVNLKLNENLENVSWFETNPEKLVGNGKSFKSVLTKSTTFLVSGAMCGSQISDTVSVHVKDLPKVNFPKDTAYCQGSVLTLDAGNNSIYIWTDGSRGRHFSTTGTGKFGVKVLGYNGCLATATVTVDQTTFPKINWPYDTVICNDYYPLNASFKGSQYFWSNGSKDSVFIPDKSGKYWVTIKNACGQSADTIRIYSWKEIFYPDVVTLNDDDKNEKLKIVGLGHQQNASCKIIDRWGKILFESNTYQGDWPLDSDLPAGLYYFLLAYPGCEEKYKGWVQVIK